MQTVNLPLSELRPNPDNPRFIRDEKYQKLLQSIRDFPEMLSLRPLVVDENNVVLGGNMRLKALAELGYTEIPVVYAKDLTEEQKREFVIKDNIGYGEWDWDTLANEWDAELLDEWGLDVPGFDTEAEKESKTESDAYQTRFEIVVECVSEREQEKLFEQLQNQGYKCRVLTL